MKLKTHNKWVLYTAMVMFCICFCVFSNIKNGYAGLMLPNNTINADAINNQVFYEKKIVLQKLVDYGVTNEVAVRKINNMNDHDLHIIASMLNRIPEGSAGSDPVSEGITKGQSIGMVVGVVLGIIIAIIMNIIKKAKGNNGNLDNTTVLQSYE